MKTITVYFSVPRSTRNDGRVSEGIEPARPSPNGYIDSSDSVFAKLLLWIDWNHNGQSEAEELSLASSYIAKISLGYFGTERVDRFGNLLRYEGWVVLSGDRGQHIHRDHSHDEYRKIFDVFLRHQ